MTSKKQQNRKLSTTPGELTDRFVLPPKVKNALTREFHAFFKSMLTPDADWPAIRDEDFVDALAEAVMRTGSSQVRGIALLQTLVYELQERINLSLTPAK